MKAILLALLQTLTLESAGSQLQPAAVRKAR
jgi:hypothetical protein